MILVKYGVLVFVILILRKILWNHISRRVQYALWIFPSAFLLLQPFVHIEAPFSMQSMLTDLVSYLPIAAQPGGSRQDTEQNLSKTQTNNQLETALNIPAEYRNTHNLLSELLPTDLQSFPDPIYSLPEQKETPYKSNLVWLMESWLGFVTAVSLCIGIAILLKNLLFYFRCRRNRTLLYSLPHQKPEVYLLPDIETPFLFGKNIYLPKDFEMKKDLLHYGVYHEYCHYKHKDSVWNCLRLLCIILYWYYPFVWIANSYIKRDCELACDEEVLVGLNEKERKEYGLTLIQTLRKSTSIKGKGLATSPMRGRVRKMKERMEIISTPKRSSLFLCAVCVTLLTLLTGCALSEQPLSAETSSDAAQTTDIGNPESVTEQKAISIQNAEPKAENTDNNPYNVSAVACGKKIYVFSENGVFLIDNNQKSHSTELDWCKLSDKPASLGIYCPELEDGIVFYYEYPEDVKEASIKALHTANDEITTALEAGQELTSFSEMYYEKGILYCGRYLPEREIVCLEVLPHGKLAWSSNETTQSALIGTISKDTEEALAALLEEKALERCAVYSPFCVKREGYSDIFITASDTQIDWNEATELLYQITEFGDIKEIEGITDIMVTRQGIVGRMPDSYNDIYIWDVETGKCQKIYDASLNGNTYLGYNTYTEDALFGITGNDNGIFHAVRLSWDGKLKYLADIKSDQTTYPSHAKISVLGDYLYFYNPETGKMERQQIQ